jgi:imidazolonepropionase-like amidohydrolase
MKTYINLILATCLSVASFAQQTPAPKQTETIMIMNGTAHLGNGEVIKNSAIVIKDGKLSVVADAKVVRLAQEGTVIDASGKHIYPGFIAPNASLGLVEIGAVRATDDEDDIGTMLPHIRSLIAYNAESKIVESMRPNGVLLGQITPRGGRISGTSSIVQFDAWNWEDASVKTDDGIHLNWPNPFSSGRWWLGEDPAAKPNKDYEGDITTLETFVANAKAYNGKDTQVNLPFKAMQGLFDGSQTLFVHANDEKQIIDAISFKAKFNIEKMVLVGGYQSHKVANELKANNIAVLTGRTHSLPDSADDDYDLPYKLPKLLMDAGVLVAIQNAGSMERANARNLPFQAGQVSQFGLDKEEALKLITLNAAKILGIDDTYGTLEVGKSATLFISEGDALDMRTNILTKAFIDGRDISLETHQTELWKRYQGKVDANKAKK